MDIHIEAQDIITFVAVCTALGTLLSWLFKGRDRFLEQKRQGDKITALEAKHDADMAESNEERQLICYALCACLDGLQQLGCNHSVTEAKDKMEKHLNHKAHAYKKGELHEH